MIGLMHDAIGVGLAATQLGVLRRLLVFQAGTDAEPTALVNPEIEWRSEDAATAEEGCLSMPGRRGRRRAPALRAGQRPSTCTASRSDIEASGLEARVIQHEIDHLDGVLMLDRTEKEQRKGALRALREGGTYAPDEPRTRRADGAPARRELQPPDVRTAYLGTSEFAATVLRRLAESPAPPGAGGHPAGQPQRDAAASSRRRRPPRPRASSAWSCTRPQTSTPEDRSTAIRAARPGGDRRLRLRPADQGAAARASS